eukprot:5313503-Amphidinium_carterae.1
MTRYLANSPMYCVTVQLWRAQSDAKRRAENFGRTTRALIANFEEGHTAHTQVFAKLAERVFKSWEKGSICNTCSLVV